MPSDLDQNALTREATGLWGDEVELVVTPLVANRQNGVTVSIDRVADGTGHSAVVKVLGRRTEGVPPRWRPSEELTHFNLWDREAKAYGVGLPDAYAGSGLDAAVLDALHHRADGTISLWLEDVTGRSGHDLSASDVVETARRLGVAQGRVVVEGGPDHPWLSRQFLRRYTTSKQPDFALLDDDRLWRRVVVAEHAPAGLREGLIRLHDEAERFFALSESLPRSLCHLDVWPNNLIVRDSGTIALLDWGFVGDGALGEDVGNLTVDSIFDGFLPAAALADMTAAAIDAYLDGLADAGWSGDERLVRLGVWSSAVKYEWLLPVMFATIDDPQIDYGGEQPVAIEHRYHERLATLAELVAWAANARELATALGRWS